MSDLLEHLHEIEREFTINAAATSATRRRMRAACVVMLDQLRDRGVRQKTVAAEAGVSASRISELRRGNIYRTPNLPQIFAALFCLWEAHCASLPERRRVDASKTTDWIGGGE